MKIHTIKKAEAGCYMVTLEHDNSVLMCLFFDCADAIGDYVNLVQADLYRNGELTAVVFDDIATELVEFATNEGILNER